MPRNPTAFMDSFALVTRTVTVHATQAYATLEMGPTQAKFLRRIGEGTASQADLARATATDPTLTSRVLQTLIDKKLVLRERSQEDRREYVLTLTAAGKRARTRVEALRSEVAARVVASLDERDLADFERITKKIVDAIR
jgi:DNA-binding MarR family transcriptional regulator